MKKVESSAEDMNDEEKVKAAPAEDTNKAAAEEKVSSSEDTNEATAEEKDNPQRKKPQTKPFLV